MTNMPLQMTFDLNFINKLPAKGFLNKFLNIILKMTPKPHICLITKMINLELFKFITTLKKQTDLKITITDPQPSELLYALATDFKLNFKITDKNYDFSSVKQYEYNLVLDIENNIYDFIKKNNNRNIKTIIIKHCKNKDYEDFRKEINLISKDETISRKTCLIPYLEENEQEKFYNKKGQIRAFLTCAALWFNPVFDENGKINMPCFSSKKSVIKEDFFKLWDSDDINFLREKLINSKQFCNCKYCEKFYQDNFLIVEDKILEYKNKKYYFDCILNLLISAPVVGIIEQNNICAAVSLFNDDQVQKLYKSENMIMLLK